MPSKEAPSKVPHNVINHLWEACHVVFGINGKPTIHPQLLLNDTQAWLRVKEIVVCEYSAAQLKGLFYVFVSASGTGEGEAKGEDNDSMNYSQNQEAAHLINKLVGEYIENPRNEEGLDASFWCWNCCGCS